jgi:MFS family permease
MRAAFRTPGFTRLYAGLTASMLGDSIMLLTLSMWVKTLTGSNAQAGLTFFFMVVPSLFAPLMGVGIDRVRRKPFLVWGNLASALMVLPLLLVRGAGDVWLIWVVAALYGVSFVVLPAALNGLLKELMPDALLVDANASLQTTKESFRLFGPLVGAALFAWTGGWIVALVDASTFAAAALVISTIRLDEAQPQRDDDGHLGRQVLAGLRHLAADRILANVLVGVGACLLVLGFTESSIYALLDSFDRPPTDAGFFVTIQGIGAVTGGLLAASLVRRTSEVVTCIAALAVLGVSMAGIALAPDLTVLLAFAAVMGLSLAPLTVSFLTLIQRRTPAPLMGRVSTAVEVVMSVPSAISLAVGSLLVAVLDWRVIFLVIGVVVTLGGAWIAVRLRHDLGPLPAEPSVDEGLHPVGEDLLGEDGRARDAHALDHVAGGDPAALGALGTDRHLALRQDGGQQVR